MTHNNLICFVPLTYTISGTERVMSDIAHTLHEQNTPIALLLPNEDSLDPLVNAFQDKAKHIARINPIRGRQAMGRNFINSFRIFRQWKPKIVHFHCPNYRWGLDVVLAAKLAGVPIIIRTEHNPMMSAPEAWLKPLLRLADQGVSRFTYVSTGNQARYERHLPYRKGRGVVIHNGIDPLLFKPQQNPSAQAKWRTTFGFPTHSRVALFVGTYGDRRPLGPIFQAFKQLLDDPTTTARAQNWRLLIVGSGCDDTTRLPQTLGIDKFVHFAGRRSDVPDILPHADLFVSTSHFEGQSIAILEAWASGVPVLATRVDGLEDVIGSEQVQRFMVTHQDIQGFANAWYNFMIDHPEQHALHNIATQIVRKQFTTQRMLQKYINLYEYLSQTAAQKTSQIVGIA